MARTLAVFITALLVVLGSAAWAAEPPKAEPPQDGETTRGDAEDDGDPTPVDEDEPDGDEGQPAEQTDVTPPAEQQFAPPDLELPEEPAARLEMAREAFRKTDYAMLVPLLQPLAGADTPLDRLEDRVEARELLAVGYFFLAQQVTAPSEREVLLDQASRVFLDLLRDKPDHTLDTLIFPASVVELYEVVRRENAAELEQLLAEQNDHDSGGGVETLYVERVSTQHLWWINFLPFGAGQFQNSQYAKATAFAILQGAGLVVNTAAYFVILSQRNPDGFYDAEGGVNSPFATALRWRQVLYGGLIGFATMWAISVIDGLVNFEGETVRIRTLDAPPPELDVISGETGHDFRLPLGLSLELRW